jgi:hypothetical protein
MGYYAEVLLWIQSTSLQIRFLGELQSVAITVFRASEFISNQVGYLG